MSAPRLFGTDGIRAVFGEPPLDETTVVRLGFELGRDLAEVAASPRVVLGGDTRASTPELCRWLAGGLEAAGAEVDYVGVVPTPAIAFLARRRHAAAGVAISASHNPAEDNGIKLIGGDGFKAPLAQEARLEARLGQPAEATPRREPALDLDAGAAAEYLDFLVRCLDGYRPLGGLRVALDAAHGAASAFAGPLFERLGARVTVMAAAPDGRNVNAGVGSTHPAGLAALTRDAGADVGFAFDGDADRAILADAAGTVRDGDAILFLWARERKARGALPGGRIVATSMSNLGLEAALRAESIAVERCDVGDRVVVETMRRLGVVLGGEQSGHVVDLERSTTGDGLLTAVQVATILARAGRPLRELLAPFHTFPQLIRNVRVRRKPPLDELPRIAERRDAIVSRLGDRGRLVLRYSGTEPLCRIMLEGEDRAEIEAMAEELAEALALELAT